MKLGEKIGELSGKVLSRRVIASSGKPHAIEVSLGLTGTVLGVRVQEVATFTDYPRADGTYTSEGHGLATTADGERLSWCSVGLGRAEQGTAGRWLGALQFETTSSKLDRLNRVIGIADDTVDEDGNCRCEVFELALPG